MFDGSLARAHFCVRVMLTIAGVSCEPLKIEPDEDKNVIVLLSLDHLGCISKVEPSPATETGLLEPGARLVTSRAGTFTTWTELVHGPTMNSFEDGPSCITVYARYLLSGLHTASMPA